jgi:valine--pyruvate aminotransferase
VSLELSNFGQRYARHTGILELMDDLGHAMSGDNPALMLGGGNPGRIPEVEAVFRSRLAQIAGSEAEFGAAFANYAHPSGEIRMREALANLLSDEYGWQVSAENIALTAGGQTSFYYLFNMLAGAMPDGSVRRILLPLTPEYVGYADVGLSEDMFVSAQPVIEDLPGNMFKYHVDFERIAIDDSIGAVCVSRPTNPTGNVITDEEIALLEKMCSAAARPLIIDCAYGDPFPAIVFVKARPYWNENVIHCMSLSKLGLPGVRTGIVVARKEVIAALTQLTATVQLAVGSVGPLLVGDLIRSREILQLSREQIMPYYRDKAQACAQWLHAALRGLPYRIHQPEGAIFLWLWLPECPIPSETLYDELKRAGVLVMSGHHFFPGLAGQWAHRNECLRISFAMDESVVRDGVAIIGRTVRSAYARGR